MTLCENREYAFLGFLLFNSKLRELRTNTEISFVTWLLVRTNLKVYTKNRKLQYMQWQIMHISVNFAECKRSKLPRKAASLYTNDPFIYIKPEKSPLINSLLLKLSTRTDSRIVLNFISIHNIANTPNHLRRSTYPLNSTITGLLP